MSQILVYITDRSVCADMNEVYGTFFQKAYPNRATVVAGLVVPGMVIEIVAYATIGPKAP